MPRDTSENYIAARRLHAQAREYRGRFLNYVAVIERDLALLLTAYFCISDPATEELFFERVACRMSLEEKRALLVDIVKRDFPWYWDQHAAFLKDIQEIQNFRNKLAHSILDVSDEALARPLEAGVGFVQWKKGEPISQSEFDDWCVRANMVGTILEEIKRLLGRSG